MPTYKNENDERVVVDGIDFKPDQTRTSEKILVETILEISAASAAFDVGETITGGTAAMATGVLLEEDTNLELLYLVDRNAEDFVTGGIVGLTSGSTAIVDKVKPMLTKTASTPYFNPKRTTHTVTSVAGGDETVALSDFENTRAIKIGTVTSTTVDVYLNSKSNTPPVVDSMGAASDDVIIDVNKNVRSLILDFAGAGTCVVEEFTSRVTAEND